MKALVDRLRGNPLLSSSPWSVTMFPELLGE